MDNVIIPKGIVYVRKESHSIASLNSTNISYNLMQEGNEKILIYYFVSKE